MPKRRLNQAVIFHKDFAKISLLKDAKIQSIRFHHNKYAALTKVSRDTALLDLTDLVEKNILRIQGGRSVNYVIM